MQGLARFASPICLQALVLAILLTGCQSEPEIRTLEAERFLLLDRSGKTRAILETAEIGGSPSLSFLDGNGKRRSRLLLAGQDAPFLAFHDASGEERLRLSVTESGLPSVQLLGTGGASRLGMGVNADGSISVGLADEEKRVRLNLELFPDGTPRISLQDPTERVRASLFIDRAGAPAIAFGDGEGREILKLDLVQTPEQGEAARLVLRDGSGSVRAMLGILEDGTSALHLVGPERDLEQGSRVSLEAASDGLAGITVEGTNGRLQADVVEGVRVRLLDAEGAGRMALELAPDGRSEILFQEPAGGPRAAIGLAADRTPYVSLRDQAGKSRVEMQVREPTGTPHLGLRDADEKPRLWMGLSSKGEPGVILRDAEDQPILSIPRR